MPQLNSFSLKLNNGNSVKLQAVGNYQTYVEVSPKDELPVNLNLQILKKYEVFTKVIAIDPSYVLVNETCHDILVKFKENEAYF